MKELQNNFTTQEQSKRLLEIGVPADSADCCFYLNTNYSDKPHILYKKLSEKQADYDSPFSSIKAKLYPSWSTGRLIEIITICYEYEFVVSSFEGDQILENTIQFLEECADEIDFSKLEE